MTRVPSVGEVMTQVVVTVAPETTVREFVRLLLERGISGAPIVDGRGQVLGVVSATNVLRAQAEGYYDETPSLPTVDVPADGSRTVMEIGTRRVVSLDEGIDLPHAAKLMIELGIRRVVVTRRGRFAGILTATDIMKWVARPALEQDERPARRARGAKGKA